MSEGREAKHLLISGIVQGVGYRYWTQQTAQSLGLSGWVRNLYDGRVEIVVQGPKEGIERLVEACREGPPSAEVTNITQEAWTAVNRNGFETRPTADHPEARSA